MLIQRTFTSIIYSMNRKLIFISLLFLSLKSFSQEDSSKTTLTLAAIYSTNANYYGQVAAEPLPYVVANATVRFPSGIYFSGMAYKLLDNSEGMVSASNLGAGIEFNIAKNLTADFNYNHTFFPENSPFLQVANANMLSGTLSLEHLITTSVNADYAFGKQQDLFLTVSNTKSIGLGSLFDSKDLITITPSIDVVAGSTHFYETYVTEKRRRDSLLGLPVFNPFPGTGNNNETKEKLGQDFNLVSYNFKLPIAYSRASYMLEASCQLSLLHKEVEAGNIKPTSFFNFSFYYQF